MAFINNQTSGAKIDDRTIILAEESRKAIEQMKKIVRVLVIDLGTQENTENIVEELVSGKYTHDFPITTNKLFELFGKK